MTSDHQSVMAMIVVILVYYITSTTVYYLHTNGKYIIFAYPTTLTPVPLNVIKPLSI